jgi:hypothetical protein
MNKNDLLSALSLKPVAFEAHGLSLLLKPWSAADRQTFHHWQQAREKENTAGLYEKLFISSVCDADGKLLFTESDFEAVAASNGQVVEAVALRVMEINGLSKPDPKASGSSGTTPS